MIPLNKLRFTSCRLRFLSSGRRKLTTVETSEDPSHPPRPKILVFGGSGFVGQSVCEAALALGSAVTSVSRRGLPEMPSEWTSAVKWVRGDIFDSSSYEAELKDATGVVSCVGAFGSNEFMERVCGDATVAAVDAAKAAAVENFVFISAIGVGRSHFILGGYYAGKQKAEKAILSAFPHTGVCLRPSGIYGDRMVAGMKVPLGLLMKPAETILSLGGPFKLLQKTPLESIFTPPIDVKKVGRVAALAALGRIPAGIHSVEEINALAECVQ